MAKLSSFIPGGTFVTNTTLGITTTNNIIVGSSTNTASPTTTPLQVTGNSIFTGNVGIGTTNPLGRLQINSGTSAVVVSAGGSVGIGTTNPQAPLHVVGTGATTLLVSGNAQITGTSNFSKPNLAGISSTNADTATDVFVYDTRKDSDGGAWRKRTQHTSWYNETLNTATRGSRRDFPAVAVIVAETSKVTIYDGDDPDLPMWMVFNGTATWNQGLYYSGGGSRCIFALNGIISWGDNVGAFGLVTVNFINEFCVARTNNSTFGGFSNIPLSNRNSTTAATFAVNTYTHTAGTIAGVIVNDVAMTVLPNAPIDPSTGLPVPTIAVATAGGVSVIKDDGTVVDHIDSAGGLSTQVAFTQDGKLAHSHDGHTGIRIDSLKSFDYTYGANKVALHNSEEFYINYGLILSGWSGNTPKLNTGAFTSGGQIVPVSDNILAERANTGLNLLARDFPSSPNNNRVAYATTSYNTGWMHGDIKGAFLSDTSTASVTGTALLTGQASTYDVNTTNGGWTSQASASNAYNATNGVSSTGCIRLTSSGGSNVWNSLSLGTLTTGAKYSISFSAKIASSAATSFTVTQSQHNVDSAYGSLAPTVTTSHVTYSFIFTASSTTAWFNVYAGNGSGSALDLDNIDVRLLAEPDRSVNNNGLAVYGTITKTAVASGSNLVSYDNFSPSNYLFQPYNSALDFGTGDFCYMCWVKDNSVSSGAVIFQRGAAVNSNETVFWIAADYRLVARVQTISALQSNVCFIEGQWNHCVFLRRSGTIQIYHNGILQGSTTNTETTTQVGRGLSIGAWLTNNAYFPTSISLFRVSSTAPSPTQILKIYNDEKSLYQENSQCTLYGSSDAVTALAYDDTTKLLSVGTSSGRSDFQGLERINNTTTAVTTAISASNSLIAEQ